MKTVSPQLLQLLEGSTQFYMAELYTFTLIDGTVLRWTSADVAITFSAHTWVIGPAVERTKIRCTIGVEVDTLTVTIYPKPTDLVNGIPLGKLLPAGGFDGATVLCERAYAAAPSLPIVGTLVLFKGRMGPYTGTRTKGEMEQEADLKLLDTNLPRGTYLPTCGRTLYDVGCAVNRASVTTAGAVTVAGNAIIGTNLTAAAGYYNLGVIIFASGPNQGLRRSVKAYAAGGNVTVVPALPQPCGVGDAFTIYPGCSKLDDATGCGKFYNAAGVKAHFRGFKYVPVPETSL